MYQFDVNNDFLHEDLEDVYMNIPPILQIKGQNMACKLHKSIYGLKQASRVWFQILTNDIIKARFHQWKADYFLFTHIENNLFASLVYVDDILVTGNNLQVIEQVQHILDEQFHIKQLGTPKYILGLEIARPKTNIFVNQRKYMLDLLSKTGLMGTKQVSTPLE